MSFSLGWEDVYNGGAMAKARDHCAGIDLRALSMGDLGVSCKQLSVAIINSHSLQAPQTSCTSWAKKGLLSLMAAHVPDR